MKETSTRALHRASEADVAGSSQSEGEEQQLISWKLLLCLAIGAGFWLGLVQLLEAGVPGSGITGQILSVARLVILFCGVASLFLAALVGLNGILRRVGRVSAEAYRRDQRPRGRRVPEDASRNLERLSESRSESV